MMSKLAPVRKRGRSTTRDKALQRDRDLGYVTPPRWRKQDIARPLYTARSRPMTTTNATLAWLILLPLSKVVCSSYLSKVVAISQME
jgi:hypothetical protein